MRGGNYEIEINGIEEKAVVPDLPFLCTHNQHGTYCGKGLVIRDSAANGDAYLLVDLGAKNHGGWYNVVFSDRSLSNLIKKAAIVPKSGKIIIYE